jgi:hypothetical protein
MPTDSIDTAEPLEAGQLATLEARITHLDDGPALLHLATEIDELGRRVALAIAQHAPGAGVATPLHPVLLRVPAIYTRTLLRAAEKYDDIGSTRRAVFALVEALRRAFEANMVEPVTEALVFILDAHEQEAAAGYTRKLATGLDDAATTRRERRAHYLAAVDALRDVIDWALLDDEALA